MLSDSEIIKSLECCGDTSLGHCENCPLNDGMGFICITDKSQLALNLINRLQAENERLKEENKHYAELEQGCYVTGVKNIKAEAYKEFAENVKEKFSKTLNRSESAFSFLVDNLLKELVGEEK